MAVPVCGRFGLWPFRFVALPVCGRFGLWPFRSVAVPVCGRSGLWPFWSVAVSVCGRFGLWPFRFWPFRFVAVMTIIRIEEVPYCFPRSSIKFQGHTGWKIDDLDKIWARLLGRSQLSNPSDLPCWLCSDHLIIMKFSGIITKDQGKVHAKGQGQRSKSQRSRSHLTVSGL